MYISARIHDSNEFPTAAPMFPGSGDMDRLLGILSSVWACCKSKMAAINKEADLDRSLPLAIMIGLQ